MEITFTPMRRDDSLTLEVGGDVLTVNGTAYDFSGVAEGALLPREAVAGDWLASDVERVAGVLRLTVILPHGADAPEALLYPAPVIAGEGPVALPGSTSGEA